MSPRTAKAAKTPISEADQRWIAENLLRGADQKSIANALISSGRAEKAVHLEVEAAAQHPFVLGALAARELWMRKIRKAHWALDLQAKLESQRGGGRFVPRIARPTTEAFYEDYYFLNRPVLITGRMADWPALSKWTPDYFVERWGEQEVEVQTKRDSDPIFEIQAQAHTEPLRFAEFIDRIRNVRSNDLYMTARNSGKNRDALAGLWEDIGQLPEYLAPTQPAPGYFWLGPAGTVTPTHHDLTNNMMAQVIGRKRVLIASIIHLPHLYNHLHVYSQVDLANLDFERFPELRSVRVQECILEPGELLFLPVGCWHKVEALDLSATMTFTNFKFDNDFHSFYAANGEL